MTLTKIEEQMSFVDQNEDNSLCQNRSRKFVIRNSNSIDHASEYTKTK